MTARLALPDDPSGHRCAMIGCHQPPVLVTAGGAHPGLFGHCANHLPEQITYPVDEVEQYANSGYRLDCGHVVTVDGPCGPTTGRAWCPTCDESRAVTDEG